MYIVSRCLLGEKCRYDGNDNKSEAVVDFLASGKSYCGVCPECRGGMTTPRLPSEYAQDGSEKIINCEAQDVTEYFVRGALLCFDDAKEEAGRLGEKIEGAILKAKSPSCGSGKIYDGTFSGVLRDGDGCFARLLKKNDINVISEKEIDNDKF